MTPAPLIFVPEKSPLYTDELPHEGLNSASTATSISFALANSMNNITASIIKKGSMINDVFNRVAQLGIDTSEFEKVPAMALGVFDICVKDIVGAIANEISLDSSYIGAINLHDKHSFVQLPKGIPADLFNQLKGVRVRRQPLSITTSDEAMVKQQSGRRTERAPRNN